MTFRMENLERLTLIEMEEFVKSHRGLNIVAASGGTYAFIERVLRAQAYRRLKKTAKGTASMPWTPSPSGKSWAV